MNKSLQRAMVVVGTTLAALGTWTVLRVVGRVDLAVSGGGEVIHVGAGAVAATAMVAALAGWALLAVLERWTSRPRRTWIVIALGVFLLSLLGPLGGQDAAAIGGLCALHATVAAAIIVGMSRT